MKFYSNIAYTVRLATSKYGSSSDLLSDRHGVSYDLTRGDCHRRVHHTDTALMTGGDRIEVE